jgi:hypothetical protein
MEFTNPELSIWKVIGEFLEKLTYYKNFSELTTKKRLT